MKVDLRNNMLDENQQNKKKDDQKRLSFFLGLFGNLKKTQRVEKNSLVIKKLEAPKKIEKLPKPEEIIEKNYSSGIGESNFQSKKNKENLNKKDEKSGNRENFQEEKESIKSNYQTDFEYKYQESEYVKNFPERILVKWQGPDYEIYPKSKRWYAVAGLILATIVVYAVLTNSPLTAIVFILIGIVGYMYLEQDPQLTDFGVSYDGIVVGNEVYEWDDLISFWIFYDPPHTRVISLHMKGKLMPYIHIPLHQVDPVEVREKMMEFIPEIKQEQGMIDVLERLLHM